MKRTEETYWNTSTWSDGKVLSPHGFRSLILNTNENERWNICVEWNNNDINEYGYIQPTKLCHRQSRQTHHTIPIATSQLTHTIKKHTTGEISHACLIITQTVTYITYNQVTDETQRHYTCEIHKQYIYTSQLGNTVNIVPNMKYRQVAALHMQTPNWIWTIETKCIT